jgi:hypothetical protein
VKHRIPTAVAVGVGLLTLVGYFLYTYVPGFRLHLVLIRWATILAAVAFLIGIVNLLGVHTRRIAARERNWPYSIFLILAALLVMVVAGVEGQGPGGATVNWLFQYVLFPLEAAGASLLIFFLAAAAFRMMRRRPSWSTLLFVLTIVLVLVSTVPLGGEPGRILRIVRSWLVDVIGTAGTRGMLLGVALGTIATGLRVLVGIDRPHSERES